MNMQDSGHILSSLKERGYRFTKIRKAILDLLIKSSKPLSSLHLQKMLSEHKVAANKTTVYRELTFLKNQSVVRELRLGDNVKRYEMISGDHHHHVICLSCERVEDVDLQKDLDAEEEAIEQHKDFKILTHSLEFFGLCKKCQNRQPIRL